MKMLISDDSVSIRERLVRMFSTMDGIELVGEAQDIHRAYDAIQTLRPDLVILDIQMGEGSGIDLLRDVKQNYPSTVAIMLTNHPYPQYRQRCLDLGADYFFSKSTDLKLMIETVRQLVGKGAFMNQKCAKSWTNTDK